MRPKQPVLLCPGHIKSMFALPALCWALLLSLHVGPTAADEVNLMPNGGFEQWEERPAAGQPWGAHKYQVGVAGRGDTPRPGTAYRTGQGELDTERHSGRYAQFVSTTTWGNGLVSPSMPVTAGHKYRVSVWLKMVSGENFKMGVCFAHAPWTYLGEWVYGKPNGRWTQYTKEIEVPASCTRIVAVLFLEPGSGYFDDLEVVDLGVVEPANEEASPEEDRVALSPGHLAPAIARKRVAIFDEPGFPSESPRSADWYEQVLQDAGLATQRLRLAQLCKRRVFSIRDFDTLILPLTLRKCRSRSFSPMAAHWLLMSIRWFALSRRLKTSSRRLRPGGSNTTQASKSMNTMNSWPPTPGVRAPTSSNSTRQRSDGARHSPSSNAMIIFTTSGIPRACCYGVLASFL